jgi:hypothetical protein
VEVIVYEGKTVILIINGDNITEGKTALSFEARCPWAMADAFKALGMAAQHAAANGVAYTTQAERLAKVLQETYKERYPFYNGNRAARRAGRYYDLYDDPPKRRWPVPPRYLVCKGRRKYK